MPPFDLLHELLGGQTKIDSARVNRDSIPGPAQHVNQGLVRGLGEQVPEGSVDGPQSGGREAGTAKIVKVVPCLVPASLGLDCLSDQRRRHVGDQGLEGLGTAAGRVADSSAGESGVARNVDDNEFDVGDVVDRVAPFTGEDG